MGNSLGGKKTTKVMKINGETFKLKTPIQANEVAKDYPGHVLLESESVKHFGTRAKPLEPHQELQPKRLYFLVELPKVQKEQVPRRVRSGINMSAKDRLENLMLARRSVSDLSIMKPTYISQDEMMTKGGVSENGGGVRVRMRLPKADVEKLMKESKNEEEAVEKIMELCLMNNNGNGNGGKQIAEKVDDDKVGLGLNQQMHWNNNNKKDGHGKVRDGIKNRAEKRVTFCPINEGEIQIAVA